MNTNAQTADLYQHSRPAVEFYDNKKLTFRVLRWHCPGHEIDKLGKASKIQDKKYLSKPRGSKYQSPTNLECNKWESQLDPTAWHGIWVQVVVASYVGRDVHVGDISVPIEVQIDAQTRGTTANNQNSILRLQIRFQVRLQQIPTDKPVKTFCCLLLLLEIGIPICLC